MNEQERAAALAYTRDMLARCRAMVAELSTVNGNGSISAALGHMRLAIRSYEHAETLLERQTDGTDTVGSDTGAPVGDA